MFLHRVSLLSFCAFLFVISYSEAAHAFRDRCPRHEAITDLEAKLAKTRMFRGTVDDFNTYVGNHNRSAGVVLAFVEQDEIYVESKYEFEDVDVGGGWLCAKLTKVLSHFYAAPKIYMPTDYPKGSCEYDHILTHEKRHLQAVYDFHEESTDAYRRYLGHLVRDVPVFKPVRTEEELMENKDKIMRYIEDQYAAQIHRSYNELNRRQRIIDSPEEYIGVGKRLERCKEDDLKKQNRKVFYGSTLD